MIPSEALGGLIAATLAGSWRQSPTPVVLSRSLLARINLVLLAGGAGALVWRSLSQGGDTELLRSNEAFELRQAYRLHTLQAALHERRIEKALTLLRSRGIEPLLAKGWAVARHYPEPGLRPYGDVDLYVRPEQYEAAQMALFRSGGARPPAPVDLHAGCAALGERTIDDLYARSETTAVGDAEVRILGSEDHLHLLCVHALTHGLCRPLWLCDIALAVESCPLEFDWERFWGKSPRRSDWLRCALVLSHEMLGASLDRTPMVKGDVSLPNWVERAVRKQWGATFRPRLPLASFLRRPFDPLGLIREIRHHWPNPIEATVGVGGTFTRRPPLPLQLTHGLVRATRFTTRLASRKLEWGVGPS